MKNFLKFIWSGLFSNQAVLDNKNRNLYQAFIVLLISLVVAVLPVLGATLGTNGSDILTNSKNGSLDVSLNLFSKYLSEDENANFYTTNDGKYVVTGFKEKVITDSTGKHLLTVYAADNGEVLTDIVTKYTNGYVDETTKISETPRSLMLISDDVLYIYVFAGDAKNEIKDGAIKKSATPTNTYLGYATEYKEVNFQDFYKNELGGDQYSLDQWKKSLNKMYEPYKQASVLYNCSIHLLLDVIIAFTMTLIIFILTRLKSNQCEKLTFNQSLKCVCFSSLSPAIVAWLISALIPTLGSVGFIMCLGIRCVFLGSKAANVTKL